MRIVATVPQSGVSGRLLYGQGVPVHRVESRFTLQQHLSTRPSSPRTGAHQPGAPWNVLFSLCLFVLALVPSSIQAQQTTADVVGTITDSSNAIIPGAKVTILSLDTGETKTVVSAGSGDYTFTALNPGIYKLSVSAPSFKSFEVEHIRLAAGDHFRANAQMQLGQVSETVTVESNSSSLQTESSAVNTTLPERAVQDLPLNGRNLIGLVLLAPGASEGIPTDTSSGFGPADRRQTSSVSVNGQSSQTNQQLIDGMDNIERFEGEIGVRPSIDSIQEIQVQTNTYTAEVGRTAGGVINVITKSGTNQLHGSIYEFFRNDIFDASPYAFGSHLPKAELRQNQFGASIGGPIHKDKLFFFGDYEDERQVQGTAPTSYTVPTLYEEQHPGDFSDTGGAVIPTSALDKAGADYFALLPAPNNGSTTYTGAGKGNYFSQTYDARLDYQRSAVDRIFVRYANNHITSLVPSPFPSKTVAGANITPEFFGDGPAVDDAHNALVGYQHSIGAHLLFEAKASYLYVNLNSENYNTGVNPNAAFGQNGINVSPSTSALAPAFVLGAGIDLGSGGTNLPLQTKDNNYELAGAVTYTHGANMLKVGGSELRRNVYENGQTEGEGVYLFLDFPTLLEGKALSVARSYNIYASNYRSYETSAYVQDDWHARHNLTLNLGLRYDIFTPFTEGQNRLSNFDPSAGALIIANVNGINRYSGLHNDFRDAAPRLGFSFNPVRDTVVHGGFGLVYYPGLISTSGLFRNIPYQYTLRNLCTSSAFLS